jgi:hypothetical protein
MMTRATMFSIGLGVTALLSGCGNEIVAKVEAFADRACACKDAACADAVHKEYEKFVVENADQRGKEADHKKVIAAGDRMAKCLVDLRQATGAAPADAPVEGAAAPAVEGAAGPAATPPADPAATPPADPAGDKAPAEAPPAAGDKTAPADKK